MVRKDQGAPDNLILEMKSQITELQAKLDKLTSSSQTTNKMNLVRGQKQALTNEIARRYNQANPHLRCRAVSSKIIEVTDPQSGSAKFIKHHASKPHGNGQRDNGWHRTYRKDLANSSGIDGFVFSKYDLNTGDLITNHFTADELRGLVQHKPAGDRVHWYFGQDANGNYGDFRGGPISGLDYSHERWDLPRLI